jgi:RES domain-containing protein
MLVFRVDKNIHLSDCLKGIGAAKSEGNRWNGFGTALVYTSDSRALATLEIAVHLDLQEDLPTDRQLVVIEIPEDVLLLELSPEDLPENWAAKPPIAITQSIGDRFAQGLEAAVLKVPSSIIPEEWNYLINPIHPDAKKIKMVSYRPFDLDTRLGI